MHQINPWVSFLFHPATGVAERCAPPRNAGLNCLAPGRPCPGSYHIKRITDHEQNPRLRLQPKDQAYAFIVTGALLHEPVRGGKVRFKRKQPLRRVLRARHGPVRLAVHRMEAGDPAQGPQHERRARVSTSTDENRPFFRGRALHRVYVSVRRSTTEWTALPFGAGKPPATTKVFAIFFLIPTVNSSTIV